MSSISRIFSICVYDVKGTAGKPEVGLPRASHGTRDMEIKGELHPYFI